VVSLHLVDTIRQPTVGVNYPLLMPAGSSYVALFRDPLRCAVQYTAGLPAWSYAVQFKDAGSTISPNFTVSVNETNEVIFLDSVYATSVSANPLHGPTFYPGSFGSRTYYWLDYNTSVAFTESVATAANLTAYVFTGEDDEIVVQAFAAGTTTFTQTVKSSGGYFRFQFLPTVGTALTLTMTISGSGDGFAHLSIPTASVHLAQITEARINSLSMMVSPAATLLNRGGTITGGNLVGSDQSFDFVSSSKLANLPQGQWEELGMEKGMYTFLKPAKMQELEFHQSVVFDNGLPSVASFDLKNPARYAAFYLITDVSGGSAPGMEYIRTLNYDIEYRTDDQWFECHRPPGQYMDTVEGLHLLEEVNLFHENPLHLSDIRSALMKGYNFARRHAPTVTRALAAAFPQYSGMARMAGAIASNLPEL
jgi:hypothetical protein